MGDNDLVMDFAWAH